MERGNVVVRRRVFLGTVATGAAAIAVRVALLPRPPSEGELARIAEAAAPARPPVASVSEVDVGASMGRLNALAERLEDAPHVTKFRPDFKINTVEREPQKRLVSRDAWSVTVDGLVDRPFTLAPPALADLPPVERTEEFHCVEGWGIRGVRWAGVSLADVLERAGVQPTAGFVTFETLGGVYTDSLSLEQAAEPDVMMATHMNGAPLSDQHGYPIRLVVPSMFGYKSVKWVSRIRVDATREIGFWEKRGWQVDPYV